MKRDGALALTFVNTASERRRPLSGYADLVTWGRQHGALSAAEADRLERAAAERAEDAEVAFEAAVELRDVLASVFNAAADGEELPGKAVESLSAFLVRSIPPRRLVLADGRCRLEWAAGREEDLARPLWHVVLSATAVLTSEDCGRVARCAGEDCGVLFVARNPGSPRKWCHESCGHRSRSLRRYYDTVKPHKAKIRRKARANLRKSPAESQRS